MKAKAISRGERESGWTRREFADVLGIGMDEVISNVSEKRFPRGTKVRPVFRNNGRIDLFTLDGNWFYVIPANEQGTFAHVVRWDGPAYSAWEKSKGHKNLFHRRNVPRIVSMKNAETFDSMR